MDKNHEVKTDNGKVAAGMENSHEVGLSSNIARIKKTGKAVLVGLIILAILLLWTIILYIVDLAGQKVDEPIYETVRMFATLLFLLAVVLVAARIFYNINKAGTPFIPAVVKGMKAAAVLVAFMIAVPHLLYEIMAPNRGLSLLDPNTLFALLCGGIVFCFAVVFEYGCLLQAENDETL